VDTGLGKENASNLGRDRKAQRNLGRLRLNLMFNYLAMVIGRSQHSACGMAGHAGAG
jgi:hypothetical protein